MKHLMFMDALDAAKDIYDYGFNAMYVTSSLSLKSLSLGAFDIMKTDHWYNTYRYSFYHIGSKDENESPGEFDNKPTAQYADTLVNDLFNLNQEGIETEAALIMNVWMAVAHYLEDASRKCKDVGQGKEELDLAAAYWIGLGQKKGHNEYGYLLYNLAENAGILFQRDQNATNQNVAEANKNIISFMNQINSEIIDAGKCPGDYEKFRSLVNQIISQMTVPLVQNLIHYMAENKPKKIELYALAITPQIAACDQKAYYYLLEKLVLNTFNQNDFNEIVSRLQSLYPCLRITCGDIGTYTLAGVPQCDNDTISTKSLAGYSPSSDIQRVSISGTDVTSVNSLHLKGLMFMAL